MIKHSSFDTAVVIVSHNEKELHRENLSLIVEEGRGKYDIFLIDNASTDGTIRFVSTHFPEVKIIRVSVNRGIFNGYTEGLRLIMAKYYVLIGSDFEVTPGWFEPLYNTMESDPSIAVSQPKIHQQVQRDYFGYQGASGGFLDILGYAFSRGRIFFDVEKDDGQYNNLKEVFWASSECFFVRADIYWDCGGFDQDFYMQMGEIDLCWRIKNAGYRIFCVPNSLVYHTKYNLNEYKNPQRIFYRYRNSLILLLKNLPVGQIFWKLPLRSSLDIFSIVRSLYHLNGSKAFAIIKAQTHFYFYFFRWYKKRKKAIKLQSIFNDKGLYKRIIVWDYFIRKRKKFSELKFKN